MRIKFEGNRQTLSQYYVTLHPINCYFSAPSDASRHPVWLFQIGYDDSRSYRVALKNLLAATKENHERRT